MSKRTALTEEEKKARAREKARQRYAANPEAERERQRQWRKANKEKKRKQSQQWYANNRDRARYLAQQYYKALSPEEKRERRQRWRAANPEQVRQHDRRKEHARRARERNAIDPCQPVTTAAIARRFLLFGNACCYCGDKDNLSLEHVVPLAKKGLHIPSNLAPACMCCNSSKRDIPVETWYLSQPFFSLERWDALQAHTGRHWSGVEQLCLLPGLFDSELAA